MKRMFCPRCATEEQEERQFCRVCGSPLSDVRLALDGRVGEALKKLEAGEIQLFRPAAAALLFLFLVTALVNLPSGVAPLLFGLLSGALLSAKLVHARNERRLDDARKLLGHKPQAGEQKSLRGARTAGLTLPLPPDAAPGAHLPAPYSAVEATTLELDETKRARRPDSA
jgi:hypothetical protein